MKKRLDCKLRHVRYAKIKADNFEAILILPTIHYLLLINEYIGFAHLTANKRFVLVQHLERPAGGKKALADFGVARGGFSRLPGSLRHTRR